MNPIIENILKRRSVRSFSPETIKKEELELLCKCAIYAPNGLNRQSWRFTILSDAKKLKELSQLARDFFVDVLLSDKSPAIYETFQKRAQSNPDFSFFYNAPALIISSNDANNNSGIADCSAAVQNIMLAARSMNIGSCWINTLHYLQGESAFTDFLKGLGIPANHKLYASVALGFCDKFPEAPDRNFESIAWAN